MAITDYYVDPAINADSGTGTIGDPFGDLQYALNTVTRNATSGDRFNIKAGTAEILTADLSLATYGTPTSSTFLRFQGYTAAQGDGGIGEINGAGAYDILNGATVGKGFFHCQDMKMGNVGSNDIFTYPAGTDGILINCELYGSSRNEPVFVNNGAVVIGCYIHSMTGPYAIRFGHSGWTGGYKCVGNYIVGRTLIEGHNGAFVGNVFVGTSTTVPVIDLVQNTQLFYGNTIYSPNPMTVAMTDFLQVAMNNIVMGASGVGGIGLNAGIAGGNVGYNNTTHFVSTTYLPAPNIEASSAILVDPANGDFRPVAGGEAAEIAFPQTYRGLSGIDNKQDAGAYQRGAGMGGGGMGGIFGSIVR